MTDVNAPQPLPQENELEEVYKQLASLYDKLIDLLSKGYGPYSLQIQEVKRASEALQERRKFLLIESFKDHIPSSVLHREGQRKKRIE